MDKASFALKLKEARQRANLTQQEAANAIGRPQQTVAGWETGRSQPDANTLGQLLALYNCPPNIFFDYSTDDISFLYSHKEDEIIKKYRLLDIYDKQLVDDVLDAAYKHTTRSISAESTDAVTYINCYDLAVSAGIGEPWSSDYGYKTHLEIPTYQVPENTHYCARVNGDSMEPAYKDGDIVFVQRQDEMVRIGEIGIFYLNGDGYIKKLGNRELISLNPDYDPIPVHEYDDLRCQGRVLGKL